MHLSYSLLSFFVAAAARKGVVVAVGAVVTKLSMVHHQLKTGKRKNRSSISTALILIHLCWRKSTLARRTEGGKEGDTVPLSHPIAVTATQDHPLPAILCPIASVVCHQLALFKKNLLEFNYDFTKIHNALFMS